VPEPTARALYLTRQYIGFPQVREKGKKEKKEQQGIFALHYGTSNIEYCLQILY
jgi:hypothetical protein